MNTLELRRVHAYWNASAVVRGYDSTRGVSLIAEDNLWIAVVGENGVGKSTLLHAISGTANYVTGTISVSGERLHNGDGEARYELGVLHVPQHPSVPVGSYSFDDAILLATTWRPALRNDKAIGALRGALSGMGLVNTGRCTADVFDLVTCVAAIPRVLLLDEIRARVGSRDDVTFYSQLRTLLNSSIVLFTEHDTNLALEVADAVLWLRDEVPPTFDTVGKLGGQLKSDVPLDEGVPGTPDDEVGRVMGVVRLDESILQQTALAVDAARRGTQSRAVLLNEILSIWPFLSKTLPAETLSGGERVTLAWLLLSSSGDGDAFPARLIDHLSSDRRIELSKVKPLLTQDGTP